MEKDIKLKRNIFFLLASMFVVLSVLMVSGATVINSPSASSTVSGTVTFNVTVTEVGAYGGTVNLTFYAGSSLTANTTWTEIGTNNSLNLTLLANETITDITINYPGILEDANDYVFNVTVINDTGGQFYSDDTNTGITVDNTVPNAGTSLLPTSDSDDTVNFSATVTDQNTTSCTLVFDSSSPTIGNRSQAMGYAGTSCSLQLTGVPDQTYTWYVVASDETNTTNSATQQTTVDVQTGGGSGDPIDSQGQFVSVTEQEGGLSSGMIIAIIVIVVVVFVLIRRK